MFMMVFVKVVATDVGEKITFLAYIRFYNYSLLKELKVVDTRNFILILNFHHSFNNLNRLFYFFQIFKSIFFLIDFITD